MLVSQNLKDYIGAGGSMTKLSNQAHHTCNVETLVKVPHNRLIFSHPYFIF